MPSSEPRLTRDEVRKQLAARTKSIADRFSALETELPVKPRTVRKLLDNKKQIKRFAALGAGVVVVVAGGVGAVEDGMEAGVEVGFERGGEVVERVAVDHVGAAVFEEAGAELEVFEGAAVGVRLAVC